MEHNITILVISLSIGIIGLFCGLGALILSVLNHIELKALKNSTHSIQYVPAVMPEEESRAQTDEQLHVKFTKAGVTSDPFDSQPDEVIL